MLKSSIGFSDIIEKNDHPTIIQKKYDFFLRNSMLSDCYFYLGYVTRENFVSIKNGLNRHQDYVHILRVAFDIESDSQAIMNNAEIIENSCNSILDQVFRA